MHWDIRTIPHEEHRYETVGDYFLIPGMGCSAIDNTHDDVMMIRVSQIRDPQGNRCVVHEFLVGGHEYIESFLCEMRGISEEEITAFDKWYEANRKPGDTSEPGDDPRAPYHREHVFATKMEKALAAELEVDWDQYEANINAL